MRIVRCVSRPTLLGAFLGAAIGVCEAARLYFVPTPPLLVPDVRYVIWFLAPLVDLVFGGLIGLVFGLVAASLWAGARVRRLVAALLGVLGIFSVLGAVVLLPGIVTGKLPVDPSWRWLGASVAFFTWTVYYWRRPLRSYLEDERPPQERKLATILVTIIAVSLVGVGAFELDPDLSPPSVQASSTPPPGKPNIVLITLDTVRADHLSLYGYSRPTTPNLDRWARQGVVFDNAIAPSSWTLPSHASMFTGLLPHQHGADWSNPVDTGRWTLAEVLRAYGYDTAGFFANPYYGPAGWGTGQGFQVFEDVSAFARHNLVATWAGTHLLQPYYYDHVRPDHLDRISASEINRDVFRWYGHDSGHPFFLFVNYVDAHEPHIAPAPYNQRFGRISRAVAEKGDRLMASEAPLTFQPQEQLSGLERRSLVDGYDNGLAYLDSELNELLRFLASQPDSSNTIVIITSDHGQAFGSHGFYGHGNSVYRELLHVPLIVLGPGVPAGLRIADTVTTRKLFATVLDLTLGIRQPFDDNSLARYWRSGFKPDPDDGIAISELAPRKNGDPSYISLTTSEWQYIRDSQGHQELYDWKESPAEDVNLAGSHPEQMQALEAFLRGRISSSLGPWVEPEYLAGLVPAGSSPTDRTAFGLKFDLNHPELLRRVGVSQAYFTPQPSEYSYSAPRPEPKPDQELLESLPYH